MTVRVRFAPSPTGFLHVGGARTALFNWLWARKVGGTFVLRIEDTDRARSTEAFTAAILDGLSWLGMDWDEGPHFQAQGLERHRADALRLLEEGKAYKEYSGPDGTPVAEDEAGDGAPFAIRFRIPEGETRWDDLVHGEMRFRNEDIEDLVILRSDGTPTYNLAVVSDDADMRISHVIRGDDHLSNTPKQILLYRALGIDPPSFGHVPMILGADGKRLSKRHGALAVGDYANDGVLPWAMVNFLALLGWSPGDDREVLGLEELIEAFSLDRILRKSAVFDLEKLRWLNGRHLAAMSDGALAELLSGEVTAPAETVERFVGLLKGRVRSLDELAGHIRPYLDAGFRYDDGAVSKHWSKDPEGNRARLSALADRLGRAEWEEAALEAELRALAEELEVGAGKLIHPLRLALVGQGVSPGIFEVLVALGRDETLSRISRATEEL